MYPVMLPSGSLILFSVLLFVPFKHHHYFTTRHTASMQ